MMKARRFFRGQRHVNRTLFEIGDRAFHIVYKQSAKIASDAVANQDPLHRISSQLARIG
jgi:hypothetical protein